MDITAVREGLASAAGTIPNLRTREYVPDSVEPPMFIVGEYEITWDQAMARGLDQVTFTCYLVLSRASDRAGQQAVDGYLTGAGASSLKTALEADRTLGGACSTLRVESARFDGTVSIAGVDYYGAKFTVATWG